jgi:hypothetical protein
MNNNIKNYKFKFELEVPEVPLEGDKKRISDLEDEVLQLKKKIVLLELENELKDIQKTERGDHIWWNYDFTYIINMFEHGGKLKMINRYEFYKVFANEGALEDLFKFCNKNKYEYKDLIKYLKLNFKKELEWIIKNNKYSNYYSDIDSDND